MSIQIRNDQKTVKVNQTAAKRLLQKCLRHLNFTQAEISVLFTNDAAIQALNTRHRKINRPTDILSFGMREQRHAHEPLPPHPEVLGDLVVSLQTIQRQALERGATVQDELEFILIHGLLHLLGYDHATEAQKIRMDALQSMLLAACKER